MWKGILTVFLCILCAAHVWAQSFQLKSVDTGQVYGPVVFRHNARIQVGSETYIVLKHTSRGGVVTFPDSKKRRFTEVFGIRGETVGPYRTFKFTPGLLIFDVRDGPGIEIPVDNLARVSFGKQTNAWSFPLEIETIDGKKEVFRLSGAALQFSWPDSVARSSYGGRMLPGMTIVFDPLNKAPGPAH